MSVRLTRVALLCALAGWGCVHAKVEGVGADGAIDAPRDQPDAVRDGGDGRDGDGAAERPDGVAGRDGGQDGSRDGSLGGMDGGRDAADARDAGDLGAGGRGDAGLDAPAPTCSDHTKNSDETDIDCGGHCGKCPPGRICQIGVDCIFGTCKSDHTCGNCSVAADCAGVETACVHRSCTVGTCGSVREPAGSLLPQQTTGDCKSSKCAADGTVIVVDDATDLPDDGYPCTNDFCMAGGTPTHSPLPPNSPCGGLNRCNGSGECVGCLVPGDCPGTDTACQVRTCTSGVCGFNFQPVGTRLADPAAGDCKGVECDGKGNIQSINDDLDLPVDGNPCTADECNAGTAAHRPVASGTGCGGALVCDGANRCVECLSAATCPGTDTECHTRTCFSGACGISNTAPGTVLAAQVANDCKRRQCDRLGEVTTVAETSDLPIDGNPCTFDVCRGDTPTNPPVPSGNACGGTSVCDGQGACVGCVTAATCPGSDTECHTRTCVSHTCGVTNTPPGTPLFAQTNGDCKTNQCDGAGSARVVSDDDLPVDGNPCTVDVCSGGVASNPLLPSGFPCGTGLLCNDLGACVGCRTAADCSGSDTACQVRTCSAAGTCGVSNVAPGTALAVQTAGDCKREQCDGNGQVVTVPDDNDRPIDGNACTMDLCLLGFPSNPPEPRDTPCAQSGGLRCNGLAGAEACVQCNTASQCPGGPDTECHTRTCSAAGICALIFTPPGSDLSTQTAGDCKRDQCDGAGGVTSVTDSSDRPVDGNACTKDLCTGNLPSNPPEDARAPCSDGSGSLCNGASACVQCLVASDCPDGPDTQCRVRTCGPAGTCGTILTSAGTVVGNQPIGDCHHDACDGAGAIVAVVDDTDVFIDGNGCTRDVCQAGMPSNPLAAKGTACQENGGSLCDGAGTCAQCLTDAQCDASHDTPCNKIHCVLGACSYVPEPANAPLPDPLIGDCHASVCDGVGAVSSVVDDYDVPASTNVCKSTSCLGGVPGSQNLPSGTVCTADSTHYCDGAGNCL